MQEAHARLQFNFSPTAGVAVIPRPGGGVELRPTGKILVEGKASDAARVLGIPKRTVLDMINRGMIKAYKLHDTGIWRVSMPSVYDLKERRMEKHAMRA